MKKRISQKIIAFLIVLVLFNFTVPIYSYGYEFGDITSSILKEFVDLIASLGDVAMGALNHFMLGTSQIIGSSMLELHDKNIIDESYESYLCPKVDSQDGVKFEDIYKDIKSDVKFDGLVISGGTQIPNFLYCPENIFADKIAALDINFLKPHKFTQVEYGDEGEESKEKATSAATILANIISSWYKIFRRIAIVGLLSVLVYLGIRIMISSTAVDKAKYKETFNDWLVALVLVVVIHYIMAGILMFTDNVTQLINKSNKTIVVRFVDENGAEVKGDGGEIPSFRTNLIGYIRFRAQSKDFGDATAYTIIYLALVIFTCMFTVTYLKRFFFMAFFTMIAPLVALTYPLDKLRDGKAQAFDMWFKEYTMNVIIQPVHLILYTVLVSSAMDLALNNPIYACVSMLSLLPAEKFIKKMFGLDRAQTTSGLGEIAGGALAMQGIKMIGNAVKGKEKEKSKISAGVSKDNNVRQVDKRGASSNSKDSLAGFLNGGNSDKNSKKTGKFGNENVNNSFAEGNSVADKNLFTEGNDSNDNVNMFGQEYRKGENSIYLPDSYKDEKEVYSAANGKKIDSNENTKVDVDGENVEKVDVDGGNVEKVDVDGENVGKVDVDGENVGKVDGDGENENLIGDKPDEKMKLKDKAKKVGHAMSTSLIYPTKRKIKNSISKEGLKEGAKKGGKFLGRTAFKVATKGAGMAIGATALGTAAMAAGIATGDLSKAASMAAGGIALGAGVGGSVTGRLGDKAKGKFDEKKQAFDAAYYDKAELKRKQQEKYDKNWKKNEDNYQYLYKQGLSDKEAKEFLESGKTQKYLDAGVTDIGTIYKTQKLMNDENRKGNKSEDYEISLAQLAAKQNSEYVSNYNMQNSVMDNLEKNGVNKSDTKNINKDLIKILE